MKAEAIKRLIESRSLSIGDSDKSYRQLDILRTIAAVNIGLNIAFICILIFGR